MRVILVTPISVSNWFSCEQLVLISEDNYVKQMDVCSCKTTLHNRVNDEWWLYQFWLLIS